MFEFAVMKQIASEEFPEITSFFKNDPKLQITEEEETFTNTDRVKGKLPCSRNDACRNRQRALQRLALRVVANASVQKPGNYGHFGFRGMKVGCEIWAKEKRTRCFN
ncbi:hypothetical protein TNCT_10531 [Trichonephila clavata]|uniref:Uncharacterized protein n=1 Tax=Trichonephila clavata TaxID=2740835 RepID=A0A8X6LT03_TRICU|nr:hypothetical protein TNCT_10531 [Trichonephila clavata]